MSNLKDSTLKEFSSNRKTEIMRTSMTALYEVIMAYNEQCEFKQASSDFQFAAADKRWGDILGPLNKL